MKLRPNVTLTNHVYSPIPLAISEKTWQKLSAGRPAGDHQALHMRWRHFSASMIKDNDDKLLDEMAAKGAKVNRKPDTEAFRKSVEPVYAKAREKYGQDVDTVLAEAAAVRKAVK
jgi:TRAP-type C4-dicarboxylate transport system substrate-binding protein